MKFDAQKVKELRRSRGFSLGEVARRMAHDADRSISRSAIQNWEAGRSLPCLTNLLALAQVLGISDLNEFFRL